MTYRAYYFTGTGNTERALGIVGRELAAAGIGMDARRIERGARPGDGPEADPILVASPVYAAAPPALVADFLKRLPPGRRADGSRIRAAVLAVDGGGHMGAPWRAAAILKRRGYDARFVGAASYPENWTQFAEPLAAEGKAAMTAKGDALASAFGKALAADDPSAFTAASRPLIGSGPLGFLFMAVGRRLLGKFFVADSDCDGCAICARACPAGTILMRGSGKGRPYWKSDCESCNRCINVCPKKAIVTSIGRIASLTALAVGGSWAGIAAYASFIAPVVGSRLPAWASITVYGLAVAAIVVLAHIAALALDRIVVSRIQRCPVLRRFFFWSFNKDTRRYRAEGWKPNLRSEAP